MVRVLQLTSQRSRRTRITISFVLSDCACGRRARRVAAAAAAGNELQKVRMRKTERFARLRTVLMRARPL